MRRSVLADRLQLPGEAVAFHLPFAADSEVRMSFRHESSMQRILVRSQYQFCRKSPNTENKGFMQSLLKVRLTDNEVPQPRRVATYE